MSSIHFKLVNYSDEGEDEMFSTKYDELTVGVNQLIHDSGLPVIAICPERWSHGQPPRMPTEVDVSQNWVALDMV